MQHVYIIDISKVNYNGEAEHDQRADLVFLNKDLFRGCTMNYYLMKSYFDFLTEWLSDYVTTVTFDYEVPDDCGFDEEENSIGLEIASVNLYNTGKYNPLGNGNIDMENARVVTMPIIRSAPTESPMEKGKQFFFTEALNEAFSETILDKAENFLLTSLLGMFILPNKYVYTFMNDPVLCEFKDRIASLIPELIDDMYTPSHDVHVDVIYLLKMWVTNFKFID